MSLASLLVLKFILDPYGHFFANELVQFHLI